jgi:hypothetical protein
VIRTLPLTVLAWEGPLARAYLVRMARAGLRPERILLMVTDPFTVRTGASARLKSAAPLRWARWMQERSHLHHPFQIRKKHPDLVRAIADALSTSVEDPMAWQEEMYDSFSYEHYADQVLPIPANSYKDPALVPALSAAGPGRVLYTGGGIVPPAVFAIPGIRMIHVHTGLLPYVRGADVLLWSLLVRGRPGVSAFFMTEGLDDGDIVAARECDPLQVTLPGLKRADDDTLYRSVFSFIDPLIRAQLLVDEVLAPSGNLATLAGASQDLSLGITYHFMHPELRHRALRRLFASPPLADRTYASDVNPTRGSS